MVRNVLAEVIASKILSSFTIGEEAWRLIPSGRSHRPTTMRPVLPGWADYRRAGSWAGRFRQRRFAFFQSLLRQLPEGPVRILDVGGTPEFWSRALEGAPARWTIVVLNLARPRTINPAVTLLRGDACRLPFADGTFDVVFSKFDVVEPDLLYLSNERASDALTPLHVHGVPELVIEIGSPGTRKRDETIKRRLYERAGVEEYWVVDTEIDTIRVYRREADGFARVVELSAEAGDVLTTPLLPGLEIPLSRVFRA